jgi:hypothetical protein
VAKLSFINCSGLLGQVISTVKSKPVLNADSKTNRKGQTDAIITGVKVSVSMTGCHFVVTGSAPGFYTNKTHTLTMTPKLPIKPVKKAQLTVSGVPTGECGSLVSNGDHPTYVASYKVSRAISIKSS